MKVLLFVKKLLETPLGKVLLEAWRWAFLALVSVFVTKLLELIPGLELDPAFEFALLSALRFIDAALHKSGVAVKGITRV